MCYLSRMAAEQKHGVTGMANLDFSIGELKFSTDATAMSFEGYGAVFGNVDSYGDVIQPGAFADSLAGSKRSGQWPAMLLQHGGFFGDDQTPIGIWTDMAEDGKGLWVQGKLAPTARGQDIYALLKMTPRPAISGLSIGYVAKEWTARSKPDEPRRTLKKVDLLEISIVTMPANPKARISTVKSEFTPRDAEKVLRDAGLSRAEARRFIHGGYNALAQRDAGGGGAVGAALQRLLNNISK